MGQVVFPGMKTLAPGMNDIAALTPVGNYGIQASWKDGHDTGIYSFDMLRSIFETKRLSKQTLDDIDRQLSSQA